MYKVTFQWVESEMFLSASLFNTTKPYHFYPLKSMNSTAVY